MKWLDGLRACLPTYLRAFYPCSSIKTYRFVHSCSVMLYSASKCFIKIHVWMSWQAERGRFIMEGKLFINLFSLLNANDTLQRRLPFSFTSIVSRVIKSYFAEHIWQVKLHLWPCQTYFSLIRQSCLSHNT